MAAVTFPYVLDVMVDPLDSEPLRDVDFNRLILKINAIASTVGINIHGNVTSLGDRLSQSSSTADGMQKGGVICEPDPSAPAGEQGARGTRRWFYDEAKTGVTTDGNGEYVQPLPYNIFDPGQPAVIGTQVIPFGAGTNAAWWASVQNNQFWFVQTCSSNLVRWKFQNSAGQGPGARTVTLHTLVIGVLEVFEDDPGPQQWRMDSFSTPPGV